MPEITYIIADTLTAAAIGVASVIKRLDDSAHVVYAESIPALADLLSANGKSVIITDYTSLNYGGINQLLNLRQKYPGSSWMLFCEELTESFIRYLLLSDETISIIMKSAHVEQLENAISDLVAGRRYLCSYAEEILSARNLPEGRPDALTMSEKAILKEIALGKTTKQIALEKNLSFHTVNSHRKNIFRKLDINNVHEAVRYAVRAGIAELSDYYI